MKKKTLLVTASTYPRWKNDTVPPFVQQFSHQMTEHYATVRVVVPHFPSEVKLRLLCNRVVQ